MPIRTYKDSTGRLRISRLDSYIWMRQSGIYSDAKKQGYQDENGICRYCTIDHPQLMSTEQGWSRCICWIMEEEEYLYQAQALASTYENRTLRDFQIWGEADSKDALVQAHDTVTKWIGHPDSWLIMAGSYGVGKSHLLAAIAQALLPWALYISVPDFEQIVFDATGDQNLNEPMDVISHHPILLLDDVGADYGSKYPISALRRVIDFRYRRWWDYPTVITTNLTIRLLEQYDGRIADRLLDRKVSKILPFTAVKSWRRNGEH